MESKELKENEKLDKSSLLEESIPQNLTNEEKLEYLSKLIQAADQKLEEKANVKRLVK